METVRVHVTRFKGRCLQLQWRDPETGMVKTKSAKTKNMREAGSAADKLQDEIREGLYAAKVCSWERFVDRCEDEYCSGLANKTQSMVKTALAKVTALLSPAKPADITYERVAEFKRKLLDSGRTPATVKTYTGQLRTLLNWGHKMGMVPVVPAFEPMAQSESKGRPVTAEELDRMEAATVKVVGDAAAPSWRRLLQGLWLSGLRIGEAVALSWEADAPFRVDLSGRHPLLRIAGEAQKNRKDQTCPITPEFAGFLLATPEHDRRGRVFRPMRKDGDDSPMREDTASKVVCAVGEKAGVVVARKPSGKVKFGSAHDLWRSFGFRWAKKVMPAVLMELMRHSSIATTMRYYATKNAESTAEMLWAEHPAGANVFANTQSEAAETEEAINDVSRDSVTA